MASASKSKQEEALRFLNDLDSLSPAQDTGKPGGSTPAPAQEGEAAEVLAFLDEITQKSTEPSRTTTSHLDRPTSRSGTPTLRKSVERVRVGAPGSILPSTSSAGSAGTSKSESGKTDLPPALSDGGWGWGSVWSSASAAIQQAKSAVDEQVKHLPNNEQARKWGEGVIEYAKAAQLEKIGQDFKRVGLSTLTDILNVVAPPISEHEVIQVWLSHDMQGYEGIETLVYRALAKVMEQVEGGDLVVNRGKESKPKDMSSDSRDLNAVEGYDAAFKLAQANLHDVIKHNSKQPNEPSSNLSAVTYSNVYLRVQPFTTSYELPEQPSFFDESAGIPASTETQLQFILLLTDPTHQLIHMTTTQSISGKWLEHWDQHDWVEDLVAETLRLGVAVIGQEYIVSRMGWNKKDTVVKKANEGADKDDTVEEETT